MTAPSSPYQPYASSHLDPQGPGDARPTAQQILKDCSSIGGLTNKTILITGAAKGIGRATAAALYQTGAQLFLTARDTTKLELVIDEIVAGSGSQFTRPKAVEMHLESLPSVRRGAQSVRSQTSSLNIIICNAGVMFVPCEKTENGFEMHPGVNHLAHFLLFQQLKPLLVQGAKESKSLSRVIMVSSSGHRFSDIIFDDMNFEQSEDDAVTAYGQSKTANIYMATALTRRHAQDAIIGLSLHPGVIMDTDIRRHMSDEAVKKLHGRTDPRLVKSTEQGIATTVWAAVSPYFEDPANGGRYLSDVGECSSLDPNNQLAVGASGYAPHAYDEEKADRLWELSCKAVET